MIRRTLGALFTAAAFLYVAGAPAVATELQVPAGTSAGGPSSSSPAPAVTPGGPSPAQLPSTAPSPAPKTPRKPRRLTIGIASTTSYINNQFVGPGTVPPEAPAFEAGAPLSPGTPYDFFTGSPLVSGYGIVQALEITPTYTISPQYEAAVTAGYGSLTGNGNVASYWGDQPMPTVNPHLGSRAFTLTPQFPISNKSLTDSVSGTRGSILSGSFGRKDGNFALRGGWLSQVQGEGFVFSQAPQTNTPIAFTEPLPEGIGEPAPTLDLFGLPPSRLPVQGIDLYGRPNRNTGIEFTDAFLPSLPSSPARITSGSVELTRDSRTSFGFEAAHLTIGGSTIQTTAGFGGNATPYLYPGAANTIGGPGNFVVSTLGSQTMTIVGGRANFLLSPDVDAQLRAAISCYGANGTAETAGCTMGHYYYGRFHTGFRAFDLGVELIRFEPTYAPAILPYGTYENIWSFAPSWPGTWLKGTYQLVDNSEIGPNRQGVRLTSNTILGKVEARFAYAAYRQISEYDATTIGTPGFIEGFFLPQTGNLGTLGREQHGAVSLIAHPGFADVQLDVTDVTLSRRAEAGFPNDAVAMDYPAMTLNFSRQLADNLIANIGASHEEVQGAFESGGARNVDLGENVFFLGLQWKQNATSGYAVQYRLYSVGGIPTLPGPYLDALTGLQLAPQSPAFHGPQIIVEQRFKT